MKRVGDFFKARSACSNLDNDMYGLILDLLWILGPRAYRFAAFAVEGKMVSDMLATK